MNNQKQNIKKASGKPELPEEATTAIQNADWSKAFRKSEKRCDCNATFVNPNCEQHGAHEYHGKPELPGHSAECKGVPHYYDGALGYEAMKCDVCGYELDLNAEANAKATAERLAAQAQHSPSEDCQAWAKWLASYAEGRKTGAERFYEAFMSIAQNAEGTCVNCDEPIYLDIREGGGIPDWRTLEGDYGCDCSPENEEDGCGSHIARKGAI